MILRKLHLRQPISKALLLVSLLSLLVVGYPIVHPALVKRSGMHQPPTPVALLPVTRV